MRKLLILALALVALLPAAACGGGDESREAAPAGESIEQGPQSVTPVDAIDRAREAAGIEEQAQQERQRQMEQELEGNGDI